MNVNPKRGLRHPKRKPDKSLMKKMMKMEIMRTRINKTRRRLAALLMRYRVFHMDDITLKKLVLVMGNLGRVSKTRVSGFDFKKPGYPGRVWGFHKYKFC